MLGGDDVELQFDSDTMSFYCSLRLQKTAAFKADYGELCKVELSCDPDSSTVSSETRDFGGYIPKGDTYKFSILTKNKDTIAKAYNALDQSQKLEPVSVDRNENERVYHYEWVITGMPLSEIRHYMELCAQGASTLTERLEIIRQQKENAYRRMAEFQKKIGHLEWKERHYIELIQTGAEDDCNPIQHK